jgi:hypothetical protein
MLLLTRRNFLDQAVALPLVAGLKRKPAPIPGLEIISEPNCLSRESADGFRSLTESYEHVRDITLLCASRTISMPDALYLRERAAGGGWIILETSTVARYPEEFANQSRILRDVFGIVLQEPLALAPDHMRNIGMYVKYLWPRAALIRTFSAVIPVACPHAEAIAHYGNTPVAIRRRMGRGGVVFLGSMLGPNIRAEEFEARMIGTEMLRCLS